MTRSKLNSEFNETTLSDKLSKNENTYVDSETRSRRTAKQEAKEKKKKSQFVGSKRERHLSEETESEGAGLSSPEVGDSATEGGFHFLPVLGRGGRSKIGRVGMAVGSMFAATMCAVAIFGSDDMLPMNY